jgi:predicted DNA-binding transcriptional regulator AlpA
MKLLTRAEAAERFRVSLAAFDAHVRPSLTPKKIGRRVLFLESDLDAWAESLSSDAKTKPGRSPAQPKTQTGAHGSPLLAALRSDPRALEIRTRLTRKLQGSSLRRAQASSETPAELGGKVLQLPSRRS